MLLGLCGQTFWLSNRTDGQNIFCPFVDLKTVCESLFLPQCFSFLDILNCCCCSYCPLGNNAHQIWHNNKDAFSFTSRKPEASPWLIALWICELFWKQTGDKLFKPASSLWPDLQICLPEAFIPSQRKQVASIFTPVPLSSSNFATFPEPKDRSWFNTTINRIRIFAVD